MKSVPGEVQIQGEYWALIVGIDEYQGPPKLKTAVADATGIRNVLVERYGFKPDHVKLLLNAEATRSRIEGAFIRLAREAAPSDSVRIYYAGHGQNGEDNQLAWWVPYDGVLDEPGTWILDAAIRNYLAATLPAGGIQTGTILIVVKDSKGANTRKTFDVVSPSALPTAPPELTRGDLPSELHAVLAADSLLQINRRTWKLEAYQLIAPFADVYEPARLLRDCLETDPTCLTQ